MRYFITLSLLVITLTGCKVAQKEKANAGIIGKRFVNTMVLYFLDQDKSITVATATKDASRLLPHFQVSETFPDSIKSNGIYLKLLGKDDGDFQPVDSTVVYALNRLSEDEMNKVMVADRSMVFSFYGTSEDIIKKQLNINRFIGEIIKDRNVVVAELNTFDFFGPDVWQKQRIDNFNADTLDITQQIVIHSYREGEFCRAVTLGMNKFCLPEISVANLTCSDEKAFGNLINATVQTLVEKQSIGIDSTLTIDLSTIKNKGVRKAMLWGTTEGVDHKGELKLKLVTPSEGDNPSRQFAISFDDPNYSTPQEQQNKLLADIFEAKETLTSTEHDDELLRVSALARTHLPELKKLFNSGLQPGSSILIKGPFTRDDSGNEWMWVEVTKWDDNHIEGILQNDPFYIKNLKAGSKVEVKELDVFDYILYKPDGTMEGNTTGEILEKRESQ